MSGLSSDPAIEIQILLFGAVADAVGARRLRRSVSNLMSASELLEQVKSEFPDLSQHKLLLSVNQEYSDGSEKLNEGDEVAIFTAVSGG